MGISYSPKTNAIVFCISVADIVLKTDWDFLVIRKFNEKPTEDQKKLISKIENLEIKLSDEILRQSFRPTMLKSAQTLDIAEEIVKTLAQLLAENTLGIFRDGIGPVILSDSWDEVEKNNPGLLAVVYA